MNYKLTAALLVIANSLLKATTLEVCSPLGDILCCIKKIPADSPIAGILLGPVSDEQQILYLGGIIQKAQNAGLLQNTYKQFHFSILSNEGGTIKCMTLRKRVS